MLSRFYPAKKLIIVPTAIKYQTALITNAQGLKDIFGKDFKSIAKEQLDLIKVISEHITAIKSKTKKMIEARKKANKIDDVEKKALAYCDKVKPFFDEIRYHCDKLEIMVDDELWPLSKYREMLFTR
ncbi:MAG TPA: hypothetical protein EYP87_02805 [Flavobacteriaceae bacterium]|nr:hypothetical protein [Flavobacteriaceae bacterium]